MGSYGTMNDTVDTYPVGFIGHIRDMPVVVSMTVKKLFEIFCSVLTRVVKQYNFVVEILVADFCVWDYTHYIVDSNVAQGTVSSNDSSGVVDVREFYARRWKEKFGTNTLDFHQPILEYIFGEGV